MLHDLSTLQSNPDDEYEPSTVYQGTIELANANETQPSQVIGTPVRSRLTVTPKPPTQAHTPIRRSTRSSGTFTVEDAKSFELPTSRTEESDTLKEMTSKLMAHILAKDNESFCRLHLIGHELQMALNRPARDLAGAIENIMNFISDSKTASQRQRGRTTSSLRRVVPRNRQIYRRESR